MRRKELLAPAEAPKELLTAQDLMRILRLGKNKVYQILNSGELAIVRIDEQIRIRPEALSKWIEQHEEVS